MAKKNESCFCKGVYDAGAYFFKEVFPIFVFTLLLFGAVWITMYAIKCGVDMIWDNGYEVGHDTGYKKGIELNDWRIDRLADQAKALETKIATVSNVNFTGTGTGTGSESLFFDGNLMLQNEPKVEIDRSIFPWISVEKKGNQWQVSTYRTKPKEGLFLSDARGTPTVFQADI